MRELILMRHAKSDWSNEDASDHDRVLNPRGRADAPKMGLWLNQQGLVPDLIHCSTAKRAVITAELVATGWSQDVPVLFSDRLYHAAPETILKVTSTDSVDNPQRVMVVGHNPGMEFLAGHFSGACGQFPTAAIIALEFPIDDWSDLTVQSIPRVIATSRPKSQ